MLFLDFFVLLEQDRIFQWSFKSHCDPINGKSCSLQNAIKIGEEPSANCRLNGDVYRKKNFDLYCIQIIYHYYRQNSDNYNVIETRKRFINKFVNVTDYILFRPISPSQKFGTGMN